MDRPFTRSLIVGLGFALLTISLLISACGGPGPDAAAKDAFAAWASQVGTPYRDLQVNVVSSQGEFAKLKLMAKFKPAADADWIEREADAEARRIGDKWQVPPAFNFRETASARSTIQVVSGATATSEAVRRAATQVVVDQQRGATATAQAAVSEDRARVAAANATQAAQAQATAGVVATLEAQVAQATRAAQSTREAATGAATVSAAAAVATQEVQARATELAQRTRLLDQRLAIRSVENDQSKLRAFFANVEFVLLRVERVATTSSLWNFSVWNRNSDDYIELSNTTTYISSRDGSRTNAASWQAPKAQANEKKAFSIAFNARSNPGDVYTLYLGTRATTGPAFTDTNINWQPVEVTFP